MSKSVNANQTPWAYAAAASGIAATTTAVTVQAAAGAGRRNYVTNMQLSHATLGNVTEFCIRDGAGGTVLHRMTLATTANENMTLLFDPPLRGSYNTLIEIVTLTSATGGVYCNLQGYSGV